MTAQRREETLQKSSLEIQLVSGAELTSEGVTQAKDLNALVPGLQIAQGGSATQIFIRGVGDISSSELSNPGVAFNVDGVYVGRPEAVASTFYDVQRVEVLEGPQGTLYGRNTSGGAINVITNQPSTSAGTTGYVSFEGGNYALKHGTGALNYTDQRASLRCAPLSMSSIAMDISATARTTTSTRPDGSTYSGSQATRCPYWRRLITNMCTAKGLGTRLARMVSILCRQAPIHGPQGIARWDCRDWAACRHSALYRPRCAVLLCLFAA